MVLRAVFKVSMIVIVLFGSIAYLGYLRSGTYWLPNFSSFKLPLSPNEDSVEQLPAEITTPAYKWRENGRWVYGDNPPVGVEPVKLHSR